MRSFCRNGLLGPTLLGACFAVWSASLPASSLAQLRPENEAQTQSRPGHSPKGALWRAIAVPGWGQLYNRQYIKLPFLYAAIGGLTYLVIEFNDEYLLYRRAFLYKSFQDLVNSGALESNPHADLKTYYDELASLFGEIPASPIRDRRNNLRRNRDLSVVGIGLVYGLSVLDAYISAHLLDFDIGEDLTISVLPAREGTEAKLSLRF